MTFTIDGDQWEIPQGWIERALRVRKFLGMSPTAALADALNRWVQHNPKVVKI